MGRSLTLYPGSPGRYQVLLDLARALAATPAPAELYRVVHTHVARALPALDFGVYTVDAAGAFRPELHVGPGPAELLLSGTDLEHIRAGDFVIRAIPGDRVELLAALLADDALLGCLAVRNRAAQPFDASDADFLLAVASLTAVALQNARLFGDARRRQDEAELLERVARDLGASLELTEVASRAAAWAQRLAGAPAVVWLVDGRRMRAAVTAGEAGIRVGAERPIPPELAPPGPVLHQEEENGHPELPDMIVPLAAAGELIGLLTVGVPGGPPVGAAARSLVERLGTHAAAALENARLHSEVRRLSLTDPLTGLPNRRHLDLILEMEFAAAQRGRPLCFVLFDLDAFKGYNDTYGHQAGDAALVRFAGILHDETRAMNLVARYGGEEFAAVLSETSRAGALGYAERVRRRLERELEGALTVSVGVAVYGDGMALPADLVSAADAALYRAKRAGRNRVIVANS
ncbi:MAG TPA: diguanylate cyclase [Longimicrobiales bacterium]|nr:diguanylate cyclase [Longimicrobiales bacterium]